MGSLNSSFCQSKSSRKQKIHGSKSSIGTKSLWNFRFWVFHFLCRLFAGWAKSPVFAPWSKKSCGDKSCIPQQLGRCTCDQQVTGSTPGRRIARQGIHTHAQCLWPRAGSGVVRMDPLRFLAGCRTRRLNQA